MKEAKNTEEYLSSLRHDLRSQLAVIQEAVNQVRDGLGNKNCDKCFGILRPAVEAAGKMSKLIEELISPSKLKYILPPNSLRKESPAKE